MKTRFSGIMAPLPSFCDENDKFLEDVFAKFTESLCSSGLHGFYVCGGTGDGFKMRLEERKRATEITVKLASARKQKVIVHIGTNNSRDAMELTAHAAKAGADAVSSVPLINASHKQQLAYYADIARASNLPVIIYHIPPMTHTNPTVEEVCELLDIDGIVGLKMTDWSLFFMRRIRLARPDVTIFNGFDELLCPGLLYGADGGIGTNYNLFPKLFLEIYASVKSGNIARATELQNLFLDYADLLWKGGVAAVFENLMRKRGFGPYCWRRPRTVLSDPSIMPILDAKIAAIEKATA